MRFFQCKAKFNVWSKRLSFIYFEHKHSNILLQTRLLFGHSIAQKYFQTGCFHYTLHFNHLHNEKKKEFLNQETVSQKWETLHFRQTDVFHDFFVEQKNFSSELICFNTHTRWWVHNISRVLIYEVMEHKHTRKWKKYNLWKKKKTKTKIENKKNVIVGWMVHVPLDNVISHRINTQRQHVHFVSESIMVVPEKESNKTDIFKTVVDSIFAYCHYVIQNLYIEVLPMWDGKWCVCSATHWCFQK